MKEYIGTRQVVIALLGAVGFFGYWWVFSLVLNWIY